MFNCNLLKAALAACIALGSTTTCSAQDIGDDSTNYPDFASIMATEGSNFGW